MFRENYIRGMDAVSPDEQQMERLFAAIGKEETPMRKRSLRTALAVVGLAAVLTVTAVAASPTLRQALAAALGSFAPYSHAVEGISVTDQGIEIRVVSALSDGNVARVYYEIQDLTGDRLDEFTLDDLMCPMPANWGEEDGPHWASAGSAGVGGLVSYDPETRTALMVGEVSGDGPPAEKLVLDLDIEEIYPGRRKEHPAVDPAWIWEGTLKNLTLPNGKVVLSPDQTPRELEDSEFFSLSSYGFGEDGVLHFQLKVEVDDSQWDQEKCTVHFSGGSSRSDTAPYSRTERYIQTTDHKGMTEEEMELADPDTRFEWNGCTYYDCRTGITPADVAEGDVEWFDHFSASLYTLPTIHGEWKLTVPVEMVEKTSVDMVPSQTVLADVAAQTLHLSVLGCTLESDPNGAAGSLNYPMTLYLSDGRVLAGIDSDGLFHAGRYAVNHWSFPEPVEPEDITAVAIGQWYVPIEGDTTLPGCWLPELPQ